MPKNQELTPIQADNPEFFSGVKRIPEFIKFAEWLATPRQFRDLETQKEFAQSIGVDLDNLLLSQPDNGEQALEIAETLIRSGGVDVVVIDSVAALVPKSEIEGEMGDSSMGLQARLMSQALRKITGAISKSKCIVMNT